MATSPDAAASVILGSLQGTVLSPEEILFFKKEQPLGVTLFGRNIIQEEDFRPTKFLLSHMQSLRGADLPPFLVAIDQEGGRVSRLKAKFPNLGPALLLAEGKTDQTGLTQITDYAALVAESLLGLGIHVNFAPVVDVLTDQGHDSIGDRVFGKDPISVSLRAGAYLRGLQQRGALGCLKHYPGQGDGSLDTHHSTTVITSTKESLWHRELVPFRNLVAEAKMIMASHCIYPQVSALEASRSPEWLTQILRKEIGFNGVIVSDDMTMGAVFGDLKIWVNLLCESILAGCDLLLICKELDLWRKALEGLRKEAGRSPAFAQRLTDAATRVRSNLQPYA